MKSFGERIYNARIDKNMSQADLAQKTNVSRTQIVNIEYNRSKASIDTLKQLSLALEVSSDYLLGLQ